MYHLHFIFVLKRNNTMLNNEQTVINVPEYDTLSFMTKFAVSKSFQYFMLIF